MGLGYKIYQLNIINLFRNVKVEGSPLKQFKEDTVPPRYFILYLTPYHF